MEEILEARRKIIEHTKGQCNVSGVIDCPICGEINALNFAIQNNQYVHAACETEGCVAWME